MSNRHRGRLLVLGLVLLGGGCARQAPVLRGYHVGPRVPLPDSLVEVIETGVQRSITIERRIRDAQERRFIEMAERLAPDSSARRNDSTMGTPTRANDWWRYGRKAVTSAVVRDYMAVWRTVADSNVPEPLGRLGYSAMVVALDSADVAAVVLLSLSFGHSTTKRQVYFDARGRVLHISGDGVVVEYSSPPSGPLILITADTGR